MPSGLLMPTVDPRRLELPSVTLVAVTSVALDATMRAVALSIERVRWSEVLWISHAPPPDTLSGVQWRRIAPLQSRQAYSRFMLFELANHVATAHALVVQWDGFVLDPAGWDDAFLEYDYVGAPWPHFRDAHTVGNGGFSLRSRRLLEACRELPDECAEPEDITICRTHRTMLESRHAMRFAPEPLARRFSFERMSRQGGEFGFHGVFNLARLMQAREFDQLLQTLEPSLISTSERRELFRYALKSGRLRLAAAMLQRELGRVQPGSTAVP